jgi:hypothetical protein
MLHVKADSSPTIDNFVLCQTSAGNSWKTQPFGPKFLQRQGSAAAVLENPAICP